MTRRLLLLVVALAAIGLLLPAVKGGPGEFPLPENPPPPPKYAKPLGAAVSLAPAQQDAAYRDAFLRTYNSMTPENAMKWSVVHPNPGQWKFGEADALVDLAVETGRRVRGHPLVWDQQLPGWAGRGDVEANLKKHVRKLAARYRGRVAVWDAVNEPLEDDGTLTRNAFAVALGERWIDLVFRTAHEADPKARLFLNEIAAERGVKFRALLELVKRLKDRGVPIDGVGLQNHTTAKGFPSKAVLAGDFAAIGELGLDVEITEMDVEGGAPEAFAAASEACAEAKNCTGITVWGVTDRFSWIGEDKHPLPFDADGKPKPALEALTRPLAPR